MIPKPPNLSDVAKAAGVHSSTVSRVMNPETREMVSEDVAKRILAVAKRIGYRTNRAASTLRTKRSNVIGVILPDITNAVFPPILMGIEEGLRKFGYLTITVNVGNGRDEQRFAINRLLGQQVDGLIFATTERQDPIVQDCVDQNVPVISVNRSDDSGKVSSVASDDYLGMKLAVNHLQSIGHTHISHIAGPEHISTGHLRRLGFLNATRDLALSASKCKIVESTGYTREAGQIAMQNLLKLAPKTTAIVAVNDLVALGCYDVMKQYGLTCPADLSIVGHNDMPLMDMIWPPLTTVRIPHRDMGLEASRLILNAINDRASSVVDIRLKPELIVRGSTAAPRQTPVLKI